MNCLILNLGDSLKRFECVMIILAIIGLCMAGRGTAAMDLWDSLQVTFGIY